MVKTRLQTKIDGVVCPPNISETVAGRLMKLAHRPRIASTMIKLISKQIVLPILLNLVNPAPGSGKILSLFNVLCDYSVWVTETGAQGSGKTIQPITI